MKIKPVESPLCVQFAGQSVLITAGGSGLGREIALEFARRGASVSVWDVDESALEVMKKRAADSGHVVFCSKVNLIDESELKNAFHQWQASASNKKVLVNNAGGSLKSPPKFLDESEQDWERVFTLNVTVTVQLSRLILPLMMKDSYGRIVNLGSKAGRYGSLFASPSYVAAKGAIHSLTLQLAQEFGEFGITCNAVCPGATMTDRVKSLLESRQSPEKRNQVLQTIPLRRHGEVEDIASAVCYLASSEASFITGVLLDVNGGQGMST